MLINIWH